RFPKDPGVVCYSQGTPVHQDTKQQPAVLPSTNRQSTTKARVDVAKWQGRKGRPWRRIVAQLKTTDRTCWLCHHPIDIDLPVTHPLSYTVDHVVPRSRGGAPTLDNARPAHRRCNSRRGNRAPRAEPMRTSRAW